MTSRERDAGRAVALAAALDRALDGDAAGAIGAPADDDAWGVALAATMAFFASDFARCAVLAERAALTAARADDDEAGVLAERAALTAARADDDEAALFALAAAGFAQAGGAAVGGLDATAELWGDPLRDPLAAALARVRDDAGPATTSDTAVFVRYALAEAALACARLDLSARFVEAAGDLPASFLDRGGAPHPYLVVLRIQRVRLLAFRGRIAEAAALLQGRERVTDAAPHPPLLGLLVDASESLVRGNAAERAEVRALADRVEFARPDPHDYLSSGCYLLAAFGLVAIGDVRRSARLALRAGGDEDLGRFTVVDRGLAFELLVAAAALEGDLDAADAWRARAEPLFDSPIADSSVRRLISRVELLHGRADSAVAWADRAVEAARAQGRAVETAEGEIVAARARIAASRAGDASARLEALVGEAEQAGHLAARRSAARELRAAGRRLRPPAGSDWGGLSMRERDIALMVAEGLANREIAAELHVSEHTVRAHVSRVLAAFGAASRFAVAARVAELFPQPPAAAPAELTPRQEAVAERIARGAGNAEIGLDLGLSVKTVEKHIGEIFRRWDVTSRVGIARVYRARGDDPSDRSSLQAPS